MRPAHNILRDPQNLYLRHGLQREKSSISTIEVNVFMLFRLNVVKKIQKNEKSLSKAVYPLFVRFVVQWR